jgi:hypothetical protein
LNPEDEDAWEDPITMGRFYFVIPITRTRFITQKVDNGHTFFKLFINYGQVRFHCPKQLQIIFFINTEKLGINCKKRQLDASFSLH